MVDDGSVVLVAFVEGDVGDQVDGEHGSDEEVYYCCLLDFVHLAHADSQGSTIGNCVDIVGLAGLIVSEMGLELTKLF